MRKSEFVRLYLFRSSSASTATSISLLGSASFPYLTCEQTRRASNICTLLALHPRPANSNLSAIHRPDKTCKYALLASA